MSDLFPGVELPEVDYGLFQLAIENVMVEQTWQPEPCMIHKIIQLYETMIVRWGVMLVGPTGGGKSTILKVGLETMKFVKTEPFSFPVIKFGIDEDAR